jgi:Ca-activated chloride channel family protein
MRPSGVVVVIGVGWASGFVRAEGPSPADLVRRGNRALAAGEYDEALKAYREAEVGEPESPRIRYNQALVHYRQREFVKARELFTESLSTRDLTLEAAAHFNLGNCAYSQALEKLKSYDEAIELARGAIGHYRQALELNADDEDARANIETARLLIKDLQDRKKKEEEEKKKQQPQSQPSSQPQSQPSSQPQSQPSSQPKQQEDLDKQQQQQKDQQSQQGQTQQQEQKQQAGAKQQKISREEAKRLLQAVRDKERQRRREQARKQASGRIVVDKDW